MKTALEQLESWIEQFYKINGTPTLDDIKGQINLLKDYETEQLAIPRISNRRELLIDFFNWYESNPEEKSNNKTIVDAYIEDN